MQETFEDVVKSFGTGKTYELVAHQITEVGTRTS